uniref:Uncharacterized protein n=1 Tax=Knipowitschia caucasica TaxID=637954 RepID=A0AAV2JG73_KNICA
MPSTPQPGAIAEERRIRAVSRPECGVKFSCLHTSVLQHVRPPAGCIYPGYESTRFPPSSLESSMLEQ